MDEDISQAGSALKGLLKDPAHAADKKLQWGE